MLLPPGFLSVIRAAGSLKRRTEMEEIKMRLKLIACKALTRELSQLAALSENIIDITWMRQGFHDRPDQLRQLLQQEIDAVESGEDLHTNRVVGDQIGTGVTGDFDAIVLGYGLCSNATAGLTARRHRLVIPRAHDCITLFLGSRQRYADCFQRIPGCYWYTASWIENTDMPGEEHWNRSRQRYRDMGYDEETIDYLMTETGGLNHYKNAAYIRMPFLDREEYRDVTRKAAAFFGWQYHELEGSMDLLERLLAGNWDSSDFLVLEPGETAAPSWGEDILHKKE